MLAISIYYLYVYFSGSEYSIIYFRDNWLTSLNDEEKKIIREPKTFGIIVKGYPKNVQLDPFITNGKDKKDLDICNEDLEIDPNGDVYCFNLSFYHLDKEKYNAIRFNCTGNCEDLYGNPSIIEIEMFTWNLKIDHTQENPLVKSSPYYGDIFQVATNKNLSVYYLFFFTPIKYSSSKIFNTKSNQYINTYLSDVTSRMLFSPSDYFLSINLAMNTNCDIYKREYKTLLDTLSTIGGLFSTFKLLFDFLVMFYSDFENNLEITKNIFFKRDKYEFKMRNSISLQKGLDFEKINENKISTEEKGNKNFDDIIDGEEIIKRKDFNINKLEQYFFSFCNCGKSHKSMKILNLCNDFVQNYLSAENIIFNMILFESYYKDNPINFKNNTYLSEIEKMVKPDFCDENIKDKLLNINDNET